MTDKDRNILVWPGPSRLGVEPRRSGRLDFSNGCIVMGVLNVTPDSFSDGGDFLDTKKAFELGIKLADEGAAIIDIGAESTRPGAEPVGADEQIKRVLPVIEKLAGKIKIPISIDSKNYQVAKMALEAGASIINDITALSDKRTAHIAAERKVPVILMHMQNTPATMQIEPEYENVASEVFDYLMEKARTARKAGIEKEKIFIDPGIGFGKTLEHNLELLRNIDVFVKSGYKVLLGPSRKKFIGTLTGKESPKERIFGTAAAVALAAAAGVSIVRVHDVAAMVDVVKVANRLRTVQLLYK
jgi:dihydropteroate synthase